MSRIPHKMLASVVAAVLAASSVTNAQVNTLPAGVEVDASGVLRMKQFRDPTGKLTKQRIAEMRDGMDPQLMRPTKLRKVSLNRLEAAVKAAIDAGTGISDDMRYLAGLTKLQYIFVYPETGDLVIAGPAEGYFQDLSGRAIGMQSGKSVLELEDLIVALRSFAPNGGATPVISCSIDPTQEGLAKMQQYIVNVSGRVRPGDDQRYAKGMRDSLGKQVVSIGGVSPQTHFAQVLVEADYRMKLIGIGLEKPPVKIVSYVQRAKPSAVSRNAMQRWYFVPDYETVRISPDGLAMELVGNGVKLVGENEFVSSAGTRSTTNRVDRASDIFVKSFTSRYEELAREVPVYGQLRNLIDMSIAAAYLQENDLYGQVEWAMNVFGDENQFPTEIHQAPTQVESAVNVIWKGNQLMTPIGGGVKIQPKKALANMMSDDDGKIEKTRDTIDASKIDRTHWWWTDPNCLAQSQHHNLNQCPQASRRRAFFLAIAVPANHSGWQEKPKPRRMAILNS